jgi:phosphotransferase system IIB component
MGGRTNIEELQQRASRLIMRVRDAAHVDEKVLASLGARAVARTESGRIHVLLDEPTAASVAAAFAGA